MSKVSRNLDEKHVHVLQGTVFQPRLVSRNSFDKHAYTHTYRLKKTNHISRITFVVFFPVWSIGRYIYKMRFLSNLEFGIEISKKKKSFIWLLWFFLSKLQVVWIQKLRFLCIKNGQESVTTVTCCIFYL